MKGETKMRLLTVEAFVDSRMACNQSTNVMPISNTPT